LQHWIAFFSKIVMYLSTVALIIARLRCTEYMDQNPRLCAIIWGLSAVVSTGFWLFISIILLVEGAWERNKPDVGLLLFLAQALLFTNQFSIDGLHILTFTLTAILYCLFMFFFACLSLILGGVSLFFQSL